jgi:hypothetical protein
VIVSLGALNVLVFHLMFTDAPLPLALDNERFRRGSSSRCRPAAASLVLLPGGLACYSQATGNLRPGDAEGHGMIDEEGQLGVEILPLRSHPGGSIEYVGWGKPTSRSHWSLMRRPPPPTLP